MSSLLQIRDEAFSESAPAHERMKFELDIFRNQGYAAGERVGPTAPLVNESLMPMISQGCLRLIPAFREQISEIHVESDKDAPEPYDQLLVESIGNWDKMYEEVYDEGNVMRANIYRNLTVGNTINKIKYDEKRHLVCAENLNPCNFAPDPMGSQSNFADSMYVCQQNWQNRHYMQQYYPDWTPKRAAYSFSTDTPQSDIGQRHKIDEIWMRRDIAEDCGVDVSGTKRHIIVAKLIDDQLYDAVGSPYWYPNFPYTHWRNFIDLQYEGKDHGFWGYGYGTLCWSQQKMLDEFLANFILILRNLGVGRFLTEDGAIDEEQITQLHGAIMRLNEGHRLSEIEHLRPEQIPPEIMQAVTLFSSIMTDMMPSNSPVFSGEAPFGGASGRAIASLQFANFNQLSDNIREMNEFRLRRKRIKLALLQQFARRPVQPHLWRGGLDMHVPFPDEARHIGYRMTTPDLTQLPNTPAGRMEVLAQMIQMGYIPRNPLELLGITKGYGWTMEDFIQLPQQPAPNTPMHTGAAAGVEPSMPTER